MLCVVLATDGVWDNWLYADVSRFVLDATCLKAVSEGDDGAQRVALSFMQRNAHFSKKNFGRSADNATGIVMYLQRK
jgi:serine/threonine protein phosphatase PrpC